MTTVGLVHPGAMGSVLGSVLAMPVLWASEGRSRASAERAAAAGLRDAGTMAALTAEVEVVLSVCPPEAAAVVAAEVAACGFDGLYVDANAVSPATARAINEHFERFVDGGIVGPPPVRAGTTRLYLAGREAAEVAKLFAGTTVEARPVGTNPGAASAVKMCFAAWTKGTSALLLAIRALAEAEGVGEALVGEWETSKPELVERSRTVAATSAPKAWRFEAEMTEIAATFAGNDLPPGFHQAAADVFHRLAPFKDTPGLTLERAIERLLDGGTDDPSYSE